MTTHSEESWISIATQVSLEKDTTKLAQLVQQLCSALDNRGAAAHGENNCGDRHGMSGLLGQR